MACNGMFGTGGNTMISPPLSSRYFELSMAEIAVFDRDCYQLIVDLTVVIGMAKVGYCEYSVIYVNYCFIFVYYSLIIMLQAQQEMISKVTIIRVDIIFVN